MEDKIMDKIYNKSVDVHVSARLMYKKTGDAYAYADSAKTVKINAATLTDMFEKGAIIVDDAVEYAPISLGVVEGVATITYVKTDGTTATTAVLATLISG
jgi:hypothetical protein